MTSLQPILDLISQIGPLNFLMSLSATDITVVFLISKPAFLITAIIMVLTDPLHYYRDPDQLDDRAPDMRRLLP